ncbi:MAG: hypothetical protein WAW88_15570, partial [Nocardioides sp.]
MPEAPQSPRAPAPVERPWSWVLLSAAGEPMSVGAAYDEQRFSAQGDAESWIGEIWAELADLGVDAVTLLEADRTVYGPMSLHA